MPKKLGTASQSSATTQLRGKKPYTAPHLTPLAFDEAKAKLTAQSMAGDADAKQTLERIARLEVRSREKK